MDRTMPAESPAPKTCGACTFCCKVMQIDELRKPPGAWCPNCAVGSGCRIYDSRPGECREFACLWLGAPELPDALRPDKTKVVLTMQDPGPGMVALCDIANPMAWRKEPVYSLLKRYATDGWGTARKALARAGDRLWLITPREDVDLGELAPGATYSHAIGPDGKVKVTIHPPD
jgi:hypothetical protein